MKRSRSAACLLVLLVSCADQPPTTQDAVRHAGVRVADWQLAHLKHFDYVRTFREETSQSTGWIQAAFYAGLARWASATGDSRYLAPLRDVARRNEWRTGPRYWHADDQAIAQTYLFLAQRDGRANLRPVIEAFDRILAAPPGNSLEFDADRATDPEATCQRRWCWCDALFMAPPAWAMLGKATGDPRYADYALDEYFATMNFLYDEDEHLFYRDSRFFDRKTPFGNKLFWSRGNGWVFAGLPLLIEALPAGHPGRPKLLRLFREMAAALGKLQGRDGFWAPSLLDVAHDPLPETSGTAFITFGLAWGVNRGILPRQDFAPVVEGGWQALTRSVDRSGRLGRVQQVGDAPDEVRPDDTQLYGTGAFLLAASEMLGWRRSK